MKSILVNLKYFSFNKGVIFGRPVKYAPAARKKWDFACKIIDFTKKIDQNRVPNPKNFLGAFGAEALNKGGISY